MAPHGLHKPTFCRLGLYFAVKRVRPHVSENIGWESSSYLHLHKGARVELQHQPPRPCFCFPLLIFSLCLSVLCALLQLVFNCGINILQSLGFFLPAAQGTLTQDLCNRCKLSCPLHTVSRGQPWASIACEL